MRRQLRRNQLACLLLAQGVPLILAGDEIANSQGGNNNAYCQDNETGWVDWRHLDDADDLTSFIGELTALRRRFPQLKPARWLEGKCADGSYDIKWLTPAGAEMSESDWNFPDGKFLCFVLAAPIAGGHPLCVTLNAAQEPVEFTLPEWPNVATWVNVIDTGENGEPVGNGAVGSKLQARRLTVLVFAGEP
jgi:glycogen operon protein